VKGLRQQGDSIFFILPLMGRAPGSHGKSTPSANRCDCRVDRTHGMTLASNEAA